jgi:hypothetical protein
VTKINSHTDLSPGNHSWLVDWSFDNVAPYVLAILLLIIVGVVGLWDIYCSWIGSQESTVSYLLNQFASGNPIFAFFVGIVCGHLFWPLRTK